jgi:hypothetical protein
MLIETIKSVGGAIASVSAIGPNVRGFILGRGRWILKTITIRNTPSTGEEVKPLAPGGNILRPVKNPFEV